MKRPTAAFALLSFALAAACSSAPSPTADNSVDNGPLQVATFSLATTVAPGTESHKCQYVALPPGGGFVVGMSHSYTPGSHHMLLYRTDLASIPAGQEGIVDCAEGGAGVMAHVRGVIYGGQTPTGEFHMPDGIGLAVTSGEVLLYQAHYLNAGATPIDAKVDAHLSIAPAGKNLQRAGMLFFYDPFIHVPSAAKSSASMRCLIRKDITLVTATSHYHKRATSYSAFVDAPSGAAASAFYTSTDWDHPTSLSKPTQIAAGSRLRFGCDYDNTRGTAEYFQGPSAETNEMCMFTGIYYPAMEHDDEFCQVDADMFGTGSASCKDTSACLQACPAGSAPTGLLSGHASPDVDPCWQKCFTASCPSATTPLIKQLDCLGTQCKAECEGGGDCVGCAISKCVKEVGACQQHTCG